MSIRSMLRWALAAALPLVITGAVSAQDARVVLVDPGEALESAVRGSLSPWSVEVVAVPSPSPGAVMPGSSAAARTIAEARAADAVVLFAELDARRGGSSMPPGRRSRSGWAVGAMVAFAAAALALVAWLAAGPAEAPHVASMYSSRIVTDDDATRATVGDVSLQVAGRSALTVVGSDAQGWVVTLEEGSADFVVPPRRERPAFVVHAAEVRVEVVGTRFTVTRHGEDVAVRVSEGVVRVTAPDAAVELRAGERWPAVVRAVEAVEPTQADVAPPDLDDEVPPDSAPEARRDEDVPSSSSAPSARAMFERAQSLEAADPARAVALYARLARRGGPWAANALYAQARLEVERGRTAEARRLLRRYLARHPDGPNAADARSLLVRTASE